MATCKDAAYTNAHKPASVSLRRSVMKTDVHSTRAVPAGPEEHDSAEHWP
ncbi:hypothetical protein [Streptomyces sp. NPDC057052]